MTIDERFMVRALYLATLGAGRVAPNPLVGCVVVQDNKIVGEGWHEYWGGAHAEVNALNRVANPSLLSKATVYVNLEPCAHTGKTPPCASLLVRRGVQRVVISNVDPNPRVSGAGIAHLQDAGIAVTQNILHRDGELLNKRFFTFHNQKRPYIILKWAQTADGFMARSDYTSKWISNLYARKWVHKWRAEEDAVLVGRRTVAYDNPQLTTRLWCGRNPVRITIDSNLTLPPEMQIFNGETPTICYNLLQDAVKGNISFVRLHKENFIKQLVEDLHKKNIQSVIVEGGAQTISHFMGTGLWDEARIFSAPLHFGSGVAAPVIRGKLLQQQNILDNTLKIYRKDSDVGYL